VLEAVLLAAAPGNKAVIAFWMLLDEGIHESVFMRSAMCCSRVAVMLRMSRDCESSKTYST